MWIHCLGLSLALRSTPVINVVNRFLLDTSHTQHCMWICAHYRTSHLIRVRLNDIKFPLMNISLFTKIHRYPGQFRILHATRMPSRDN